MKKLILLLLLPAFILSCSSDDDNIAIEEENIASIIRISQVDAQADLVVLSNLGTTTTDIGNFYLCLGPGTYVRISEAASGSTILAPDQSITLPYDVNEAADGLAVFSTNTFGSSDPNILLDYIQWGAANQARVDQAVTAGRWDSATSFVPLGSPYNFTGEADQFGSAFYEASEIEAATPLVRILQVDASADQVWLSNFGTEAIDVGNFYLCLGPNTYMQVSEGTDGSTVIEPGANIMVDYDVNEAADGLAIFSTNTFSSSDATILLDYMQWGAADQARVDQAVTAGRWDSASNFVSGPAPYSFTGGVEDFGSTFWDAAAESRTVRILQVDASADQVWLSNFGNTTVDVGNYYLCLGPNTYVQVSAAASGSTELAPGANIMLSYDVNEAADGLAIFSTNSFSSSDPSILLDYVQWGGASQARVSQAVTAGRWDSASNFVEGGPTYNFTGSEVEFGSTFWN